SMAALIALFDVLFLFVLHWGIAGAAWANVTANTAACILGFVFLQRKDSGFQIKRQKFRIRGTAEILKNGSPIAMDNLFTAVRVVFLNMILLAAGGSTYVSVFAVATSISEFMLCILYGVPQTASAIIGVYSGERDYPGIRILVKRQFLAGIPIIAAASILIILFSGQIGLLFGVNGAAAAPALICLASSLLFNQINCNMTYYFNSVGRIMFANIITIARIFLFAAVAALCLTPYGGLVWLFYPVSEAAALLLWLCMAKDVSHRNKNLSGILLLDDSLEKKGRTLNFSVNTEVGAICRASATILDFCESNGLSSMQSMTISLAIEEVLTITAAKCFAGREDGSIDVRLFHLEDSTGIRFRYGGLSFNTVEFAGSEDDSMGETMGIKMILGMAKTVFYQSTFGVNSLVIQI
ncbi:MAG: MATE family efflux transporter, partial [Eubacteriales bacterium]